MKTYQDTQTGEIWAFEDDVDPLKFPSTPKTLSTKIVDRPSNYHTWNDGKWILTPEKEKEMHNSVVLNKILVMESEITQSKIVAASLDLDGGWLKKHLQEIETLRKTLR